MKKNLLFLIVFFAAVLIYAQTDTQAAKPEENLKADEGLYWNNHVLGKWNYFGTAYQTQLFYKKALFREKKSFWFKDSYIGAGVEGEVSSYGRVALYAEFQPLIALHFTVKILYEGAIAETAKPVLVDGPGAAYNFALPPFSGLNPMTRKPVYQGGHTIMGQFTPVLTMGGTAGKGMIALIYSPTITYAYAFGVPNGSYHYYVKENTVMKNSDFHFLHNLTLGLNMPVWGMSFALISDIEHILSYDTLWRVGLFAGYKYKKPLAKLPMLIPFVNLKAGIWLVDKYLQYKPAVFVDAGLTWKFK